MVVNIREEIAKGLEELYADGTEEARQKKIEDEAIETLSKKVDEIEDHVAIVEALDKKDYWICENAKECGSMQPCVRTKTNYPDKPMGCISGMVYFYNPKWDEVVF